VGRCRECHGWGELRRYTECGSCAGWRRRNRGRARCRRCRHEAHLNTDGLCRVCLQTIRLVDHAWILDQVSQARGCQLALLWAGMPRLPAARPLDKLNGRPHLCGRWAWWLGTQRAANAEPLDDHRVCPPAARGQLALFGAHRELTAENEHRIRDRELAGQDATKAAAMALTAERGLCISYGQRLARMLRLALAVRDADGRDLVAPEALEDLPRLAKPTADVLRRVGMLGPAQPSGPVVPPRRPPTRGRGWLRSCQDCGCWAVHDRPRCTSCASWRYGGSKHPIGTCHRCRRAGLPIRDGRCRACWVHIDEHGPGAAEESWIQLWFGGSLALSLVDRASTRSGPTRIHRGRRRAAARRPPPAPVSEHLADPAQRVLFDVRRDWSCLSRRAFERLPTLTPRAALLVDLFEQRARDQAWESQIRQLAVRNMRVLLAWVGAEAPIHEADIRSLTLARPGPAARRLLQFLSEFDLVIPDPQRAINADQRRIDLRITELPEPIAEEIRRWVLVLRGEGRRAHPTMSFSTIRKYVRYVLPVLHGWAQRVDSLREITRDDLDACLAGRHGNHAGSLFTGMRSLFRALKQERLIFRDPTRGMSLPTVRLLPVPIPTDRLQGLIDRASGPLAKLVTALVAIHGVRPTELLRLRLDDLDLAHGKLRIQHPAGPRHVFLDEVTHSLARQWLQERQRRWPATTNRHLLISQQTAADQTNPPVAKLVINHVFEDLGIRPSKLRQDRILDEARHTADPVHLMRVFGIASSTAMRYVYTAHPERRAIPPR
jgi:integrase